MVEPLLHRCPGPEAHLGPVVASLFSISIPPALGVAKGLCRQALKLAGRPACLCRLVGALQDLTRRGLLA